MSEKTAFPEWKQASDGMPRKSLAYFSVIGYDGTRIFCCNPKWIERNWYWAYWTEGDYSNDFSEVANPSECEARKKETHFVTGNGSNSPEGLITNPWVPGNEPEKKGWYEITAKNKVDSYVAILSFSKTDEYSRWDDISDNEIIAYKPITLSEPYVPPAPERELLCPFCDSKKNTFNAHFECEPCGAKIPYVSKKRLFEIYDKLNPLP